ncbi:hypothetical protein T484DRAFT_1772815 [Baffinella frigidus]|nr:hypothetical protein T484DRAFT_1772815 [Cryptophyta sp. CCMP2293]
MKTQTVLPVDPAAEQSSAISGAFVVWADPVPSLVVESHEQMKWLRYAFYVVLVVNLAVCSLILADSLKAPSGANGALSPPPSQLPVATFSCATGFKLLGAVGVMRNNIRYLTFYIAAILVLTILSLLWTWSVPHLVTLVLEALLVTVGFKARDSLMGSWFSAHRQ